MEPIELAALLAALVLLASVVSVELGISPEGAAASTVAAADIVCCSIGEALRLLLDEQALAATSRR